MSEEMFNDGINVDDIYALLCMNRTNNLCNNTTIQTHEAQYDEELIAKWGYYLEGLAMTPISVFGMVGKFFCLRFANFDTTIIDAIIALLFLFIRQCKPEI